MLRETRAKALTLATTLAVVALAAAFAGLRNLPREVDRRPGHGPGPAPAGAPGLPAERAAAGRAAFERLRCAMCHSIAGRGNPANPLDGVGARLDADELRAWTLGTGPAADELPEMIAEMKAGAAADPALDALLDLLGSLR
jgi:hypothetical protein